MQIFTSTVPKKFWGLICLLKPWYTDSCMGGVPAWLVIRGQWGPAGQVRGRGRLAGQWCWGCGGGVEVQEVPIRVIRAGWPEERAVEVGQQRGGATGGSNWCNRGQLA